MRVLGIDPGTTVTGFGVVADEDRRITFIGAGGIRTSPRLSHSKRLRQIFEGLTSAVRRFEPDVVAIENTFLSKNFATALKLGQACGVALLAADLSGLTVYEYTPAEIKLAVVGHGSAEKIQVQRMIEHLLQDSLPHRPGNEPVRNGEDITERMSHHVSDALAAAICHIHTRTLKEAVQANGGSNRQGVR